ncbi:hypothetical protein SCAR479_01778 [Seiridium cardinale]|uniref:Sugar phosphate transporter domain-containing protein n=1 Tax=Seiridium cardinale TaxID=138064 RepID=A0ABR2Y6F0_9PEZI
MHSPTSWSIPRTMLATAKMPDLHPAFYIAAWIFFSNLTIIFNKWLLDTAGFRYPIILTTIHLVTSTLLTQLLARFTPLLDSRHAIKLNGRIYIRAILPIGILYTVSLLCSNLTYLYLSVPFIQMLKALAPVSTLFLSFFLGFDNPKLSKLWNVLIIAGGVLLSSLGEGSFNWIGFSFQMGGTVAESLRLLLIQGLLSKQGDGNILKGARMDPLVGLYYYAPVCAILNGMVALVFEMPKFDSADLQRVGWTVLVLNGLVAFMLNVASVFLIGRTSALAMNLTGILKSILLVVASMVIWNTPMTLLQAVGYLVTLVALFYYSMGGFETAKSHFEWVSGNCKSLFASGQPYQVVPSGHDERTTPDVESGEAESSSSSGGRRGSTEERDVEGVEEKSARKHG